MEYPTPSVTAAWSLSFDDLLFVHGKVDISGTALAICTCKHLLGELHGLLGRPGR